VAHHDLTVVVRVPNIEEARRAGAKQVMRVLMSCDPVAHAPQPLSEEERTRWASDVVFIGTWMPERGPFMRRLLELGVPLSIWGDRWEKAPEWSQLRGCWRGPAIYGPDYVKAVQCAKVMLGLLSVGNRDLSTTRSAEVPFIGGAVFCAQRTSEHEALLEEGKEAVFWSSPEECARLANSLLAAPLLRESMAVAAQSRIRRHNVTNDAVLGLCLAAIDN
jgi:spore maturation protein CgeB